MLQLREVRESFRYHGHAHRGELRENGGDIFPVAVDFTNAMTAGVNGQDMPLYSVDAGLT